MKFKQIITIDEAGLTQEGYTLLQKYSTNEIIHHTDYPDTEEEIIRRMQGADCVLVSWNTRISGAALQAAKELKYVGMCCSLYDAASANVDIETANSLGITVRGIRDYGDDGVVEFILAQLIYLYKGLGDQQWGDAPTELNGKTLGVIGFGTTGQMLAKAARCFAMQVVYFSRSRHAELETENVRYVPLDELLSTADVITTHLPKHTRLLGAGELTRIKSGAILVNTSLGPTFDVSAFCDWIEQGHNHAIFDASGAGKYSEAFSQYPNVILSDKVSGWTVEAKSRLTEKVLENIQDFLSEHKLLQEG